MTTTAVVIVTVAYISPTSACPRWAIPFRASAVALAHAFGLGTNRFIMSGFGVVAESIRRSLSAGSFHNLLASQLRRLDGTEASSVSHLRELFVGYRGLRSELAVEDFGGAHGGR